MMLSTYFKRHGHTKHLSPSDPIFLGKDTTAWLITKGRCHVFTVSTDHTAGQRYYLASLSAGDIFLSSKMTMKDRHRQFIVVSLSDCTVSCIQSPNFAHLFSNEDAINALDKWLYTLMLGENRRNNHHPKSDYFLQDGDVLNLDGGQIFTSSAYLLWVFIHTGTLNFLGIERIRAKDKVPIPVLNPLWIQSVSHSMIECVSTSEIISRGILDTSIQSFYQRLLICDERNTHRYHEAKLHRLHVKASSAERAILTGVTDIQADIQRTNVLPSREDANNVACRLVSEAMDLPFKGNVSLEDIAYEDRLTTLLNKQSIRFRYVQLKSDWWRHESGPLIAFINTNKMPVAVIPTASGNYVAYDSVKERFIPLNRALSKRLSHTAVIMLPTASTGNSTLKHIIETTVKRSRRDIISLLFWGSLATVFSGFLVFLSHLIFSQAMSYGFHTNMYQISGMGLLSILAITVFLYQRDRILMRIRERFNYTLQSTILDHILRFRLRYFLHSDTGYLSSQATSLLHFTKSTSQQSWSHGLNGLFSFFYLGIFAWISIGLAVYIAITTFLFALIFTWLIRKYLLTFSTYFELRSKLSGGIYQLLTMMPSLQTYGLEMEFFSRWTQLFSSQYVIQRLCDRYNDSVFFVFLLYTVSLFFGSLTITQNRYDGLSIVIPMLFTLILFCTGAYFLLQAMLHIFKIPVMVNTIFNTDISTEDSDTSLKDISHISGAIDVSSLTFSYPQASHPILNRCSMTVNGGDTVIIYGDSSSGKTTFLRLLLGFERSDIGGIFYDGLTIDHINLENLRQQCGVVLSSNTLIPGSLYSNIVGTRSFPLVDVWTALHQVALHDDVNDLPMKLATIVSETGQTFSFSQIQRLMIARALINKPKILLLDDPFNGLSKAHQDHIWSHISALPSTVILVTSNRHLVPLGNRAFELSNGNIKEIMNHGKTADPYDSNTQDKSIES